MAWITGAGSTVFLCHLTVLWVCVAAVVTGLDNNKETFNGFYCQNTKWNFNSKSTSVNFDREITLHTQPNTCHRNSITTSRSVISTLIACVPCDNRLLKTLLKQS